MASAPLTTQASLRCILRKTPTTSAFSRAVIREIWNHDLTADEYQEYCKLYESYFTHIYQDLSTAACSGDTQIPDFNHEQILEIVRTLKSQPCTKLEAAQFFQRSTGCTDAGRIDRAINLASGFLVPLNFKSVGGARRGAVVSWENDDCLAQTVTKGVMMMANGSLASQNSCASCNSVWAFSKSFNARQLTRLAGFDIIWTSNLLDHLLIQDEDEKLKVHVFHHVKVLENHLTIKKSVLEGNPKEQNLTRAHSSIIPPELILETMDTLALMIPRADRRVRKWYRQLQRPYVLDPSVLSLEYLKSENRRIDHFVFWGGRLRKLKRAFDDHEPHGPLQWWRDDRKPVQWWTFWVAALVLALTIIFGFTQSVTAILQLMKS
jgi:hypothetical protein